MFFRSAFLAAMIFMGMTVPVAARGITYNCDTAANHYSTLLLPVSSNFRVTGKVRIIQMADTKEFTAMSRIAVADQSGEEDNFTRSWAGFMFYSDVILKKMFPPNWMGGHVDISQKKPEAVPDKKDLAFSNEPEITFKMEYDGQKVSMQVYGKAVDMAFHAEQPALLIHCSTGEFLLSDLEITELSE